MNLTNRNGPELAEAVNDQVGLAPLLSCLIEPEISLKRIAVNCLNQLVKHNDQLARKIVSSHDRILEQLSLCIFGNEDTLLRRQTLICLANIAKHKRSLAEKVIDRLKVDRLVQLVLQKDLVVKVTC